MALVEKIVKIADAIRLKNGSSDKMTLEDMEKAIKNFNGETLLKPAEYPDYIRTEIMRVANEVRNVLTNDSFVSICMSDSHYPSLGTATLHALMAIKGLTYLIPVDFIAHLGDLGLEGFGATNTDYLASNILEILSYMDEDGADSIPLFAAIGNHDCGNYITTDNKDDQLPAEWLYEHFTKLSESDNTVMAGEDVGGYCYRDFPSNKIRVFLLNTAEGLVVGGHSQDTATSATQRAWFASKLQELNSKSDASAWSFIVLCHYPADYGASRPLSNLLAAYVEGSSFTENGTTYNFNGNNAARFIAQFHGHIHNYLYEKLYKGSTPTQYDAWRVGIPNSGDADRTNHNGTISNINYTETVTQTKVAGTAEDTSFVVNVINPSENKLYSFNYGKGYNRTIGLDKVIYYTITKNTANVTLSDNIISIEEKQPYTTTLSYPDGYILETIKITMIEEGVSKDITADVYLNNVITIPEVTGNIIITAQAYKIPTTNLNKIAYEYVVDSTKIYNNGLGYKDNARLHDSAPTEWAFDAAGYVFTGRIPWNGTTPIIIQGAELDITDSYCKFVRITPSLAIDWPAISSHVKNTPYEDAFTVTYEGEKTILTPKTFSQWGTTNGYFAITLKGTGRDLIITCGGITEQQGFTVTNNLFNISTNNPAISVLENSKYTATLTPNEGYNISNVQVIMNEQIVANAFDNVTNTITIDPVIGNITITATSVLKNYTITNTLTKVTTSNTASSINHGSQYSAKLTAMSGYKLNSVTVKMDNIDVTSKFYNSSTGEIKINTGVTGNIIITATAIEATYSVTYNLTGVSSSNTNAAISGNSYTTTITANDNYIIDSVKVTMGTNDITSNVYDSSNGTITISPIAGNIVITVVAGVYNWIPFSQASATSTDIYNSPKGYKTNTRINSSFEEKHGPEYNMCTTGYIPVKSQDIIRIKNVTVAGSNAAYGFLFTATGGHSSSYQETALNSNMSNGIITLTVPAGTAAFFRLSVGVIDDSSIITVNRPIT